MYDPAILSKAGILNKPGEDASFLPHHEISDDACWRLCTELDGFLNNAGTGIVADSSEPISKPIPALFRPNLYKCRVSS